MMLRPRQKLFVERSLAALDKHGNTLGIAPTGGGKTVMLSATVCEHLAGRGSKAAVLAHRDELTQQNHAKFRRVNSGMTTSVVDASQKSWAGQVTFAMVPTLTRPANLDAMPRLDLLVIDEAHHAIAQSYRRIIDRARDQNPDCRIFGVTATPNGAITSGTMTFRPSRFEGGGMRFLRFRAWLTEVTHLAGELSQIAFEEVRAHAGTDAAHLYGGFLAHLSAWCEERSIAYQGVPVGTIKRYATGKGNADKAAMIAAMRARGFAPADDNEADALALLLWATDAEGGRA